VTERPSQPAEPPQARPPLSTRAAPPRPRRLSRKAIAILSGTAALTVAGALAWSLSEGRHARAPQETVSVDRRQTDLLSSAPRDYADLAQKSAEGVGPPPAVPPEPIPTDPVTGATTTATPSQAEAAQERRRQRAESARGSRLFSDAGARAAPSKPPSADPAAQPPAVAAAPAPAQAPPLDRRTAFVTDGTAEPPTNNGRLTGPAGHHIITAGSTIAAALITGLSSALPGQVVAQVTEDVFDSVTGRTRLIPQGTRLLGVYDANVSTGQSRALVVWTRMILPDGRSIDLDRMIGTDAAGQSGFADRVNNHWGAILRAGLLSTLLGVGTQASGFGDNDAIADAIRDSAGQTVGRAGDRIVERQLGVQPTITIRPGARVRVLVGRDLVLAPFPGD
jgi:type IV secretion system protein VirB10